jgi:hypothetical protein
MGLPKVTYGNYNYGQYANPKAIQYKGGLGEGLASASLAVGKMVQEKVQKTKKISEDSTLVSGKFGTAQEVAAGQKLATEQNSNYLRTEKTEFGDNFKQWKLKNISGEEYQNRKAAYESNLRKMSMVAEKFRGDASVEMDLKNIRLTPNDELRSERREAMEKGLVLMNKENGITYYTFETSQGTKKYTSDEIINDKNFFLPKQKYDNYSNRSYLNASSKIDALLKGKPQFHTERTINDKTYTVADYEGKKDEIKMSIMKSPLFTSILKDPTFNAEAYYEDTLQKVTYNDKGERVNNDPFTGSNEQMEEIRQSIAENLITDAQSQGNTLGLVKKPESTTSQLTALQDFNNDLIANNFERYKGNIVSLDNLLATDPKNVIAIRQAATRAGLNTEVAGIGDPDNPKNFQYTFKPIDKKVAGAITNVSITTGENAKPGDNIRALGLGIGAGYAGENAISNIPMENNRTYGQFEDEANKAVEAALAQVEQENTIKEDSGVGNIDKAKKQNGKEYDIAIKDIPKNYNNWSGRIIFGPRLPFRKPAVEKAKEEHAKLLTDQAAARKILENKYPNTIWPWNN